MIDRHPTELPVPPLPLLITGITGVAGYAAFQYFRHQFGPDVVGIRPPRSWRMAGEGIEACDAGDARQLRRLFSRYRFASVLNCAGNCALKPCELDREMAWNLNVRGLRRLLDVLQTYPVRLVHLSVDLVFSGSRRGGYDETARTDPITEYGRTMCAAEQLVRLADPSACILRISLPMGRSFNGHAGAIDWIQSRFRHGRPATLYFDEIRTPAYTDCLNRVFRLALSNSWRGIYHAGGPRPLSLYQIAQVVNRVGGYDPRLLHGCYRVQAGPVPPRAGNVTLDSRKLAEAVGYWPLDPWPADPQWLPTDRQWHWRRTAGPAGSPELLAQVLYRNRRRKPDDSVRLSGLCRL